MTIEHYNVVWNRQSENSSESMPVGGGEIGLNVWVEAGDVFFYLTQAGCRDENGALLKHGRVRMKFKPNPFLPQGSFCQKLNLSKSCVYIIGDSPKAPHTELRLWVEVHRPVVHVEIEAEEPLAVIATFETWRYQDIKLPSGHKHGPRSTCMMNRVGYPEPVWIYKDTIIPNDLGVTWYHRMKNEVGVFEESVNQQELDSVRDQLYDPLTNLTFGGRLSGPGFTAAGLTHGKYAETPYMGWRYQAEPAKNHRLDVHCHLKQTVSVDEWLKGLQKKVKAKSPTVEDAWQYNQDWWEEFWDRSHIKINFETGNPDDPAWQVGRNYQLFRYQMACNVTGREPTMFNGGLFTYDPDYEDEGGSGQGWTPDYRRWGAGLTGQNQRCLYWPLLKSGDFDILKTGLDYYRLAAASMKARVKSYWGHEGLCLAEQVSIQGLPGLAMWGFKDSPVPFRRRPPGYERGIQVNRATSYLYQSQLEFAYIMLQYHLFSGRKLKPYLRFIEGAIRFYDEHYRMRKKQRDGQELDESGKLVIAPSRASEGYPDAVNPIDAVAGLTAVLKTLLTLDDDVVSKGKYRKLLKKIPSLPTTIDEKGMKVLIPAENHQASREHPVELKPLFPYDIFGPGRPDWCLAHRTWSKAQARTDRLQYISFEQGPIHAARLGQVKEAVDNIVAKLSDSERRFPTFWGPGYDWVPDHNWGGSGMIGLQEMLVQSYENKIWLLPAWPEEWDVDFKLHAPQNTIIEASVRAGKVINLKVSPEKRREDVIIENKFS